MLNAGDKVRPILMTMRNLLSRLVIGFFVFFLVGPRGELFNLPLASRNRD